MIGGISLEAGNNALSNFDILINKKEELLKKVKVFETDLESITNSLSNSVIMVQQKSNQERIISITDEILRTNKEIDGIDNELVELMRLREKKAS